MATNRRSLAIPHRAMRTSRVQRFHAVVGFVAFLGVALVAWNWREAVWQWQMSTWAQTVARLGVNTYIDGYGFGWDQTFSVAGLTDLLLLSAAVILLTYLIFRSSVAPSVKGLFAVIAIPLFLYVLVTYWTGAPPVGALNHVGPEWLYGELVVWCLVPLLYALLVFPVPFALHVKLLSLISVLVISVAWRTFTPVVYMLIAVYSQGTLSVPAWMLLGPWADYLYIIPVFAITLSFYKGGKAHDYRT